MIEKDYIGYNLTRWKINAEITEGVKTEIGTEADYKQLAGLGNAGGLVKIDCVVDDVVMHGTCLINDANDEYIDFGTITNFGGSPHAVAGTVTHEAGKMYVVLNIVSI